MSFFISSAYAQEAAAGAGAQSGGAIQWIFLVGFIIVFYFLILRPQMKRTKEHKNLLSSLKKGDEVLTTGGILGVVTKVSDEMIVLNVAENIELNFQKAAIVAVLPKGTIK